MPDNRRLRGSALRYALTMHLFETGPATIANLVEGLGAYGFEVDG